METEAPLARTDPVCPSMATKKVAPDPIRVLRLVMNMRPPALTVMISVAVAMVAYLFQKIGRRERKPVSVWWFQFVRERSLEEEKSDDGQAN